MKTIKLSEVPKSARCSYKQLQYIINIAEQNNIQLPAYGYHLQKYIGKSQVNDLLDDLKSEDDITVELD